MLTTEKYIKMIDSYSLEKLLKRIDIIYDDILIKEIEAYLLSINYNLPNKTVASEIREYLNERITDLSLASIPTIERVTIFEAKKNGVIIMPTISRQAIISHAKGTIGAGITSILNGSEIYEKTIEEIPAFRRGKNVLISGSRKILQQPSVEIAKSSNYIERVIVPSKESCRICRELAGIHKKTHPNAFYNHDSCRCIIKPYFSL